MNLHRVEALTLRTYPYGESHKIAVFLTREFGKVRGIAHGAKKMKSRFGGSLEPLTYLHLTFYRKEHQELAVVQNCEIVRAFPAYQLKWEVNLHFNYFAELLMEFGKEQEESENLFRLTLAVLEASQTVPVEIAARYFEFWILKLEGVLPSLDQKLSSKLAAKMFAMLKRHPSELSGVSFTAEEMERLERISSQLIECHLEKQLKTPKMLKELL